MRRILVFLFFLSGFSALIYQVAWVRMLNLVFGVTSFAVATVLSAFMAGLALGSYWGGRFIERRKAPLRAFAVLEVGIGAFALVFPALLSAITALYIVVDQLGMTSFYVFSLLRFLLAFSIVLVPTILMGATLPVLARCYVRSIDRLGPDMGELYSANNVGAVLGALVAGFVLIHALGVRESTHLAAGISVLVGLVAFYLHYSDRKRGQVHFSSAQQAGLSTEPRAKNMPVPFFDSEPVYPRYAVQIALWVFGIEGFTSLAYEVVWTRMLASSMVVATVHAFALVAATAITGLALGSFLISRVLRRRMNLLVLLGGIEIAIGVAAVLLLPLFRGSPQWILGLLGASPTSWGDQTLVTALWLGVLMLVPTTLMGATFPIVSRIYTASLAQLGSKIGKVGFLDTVGSIFGAFAGGFLLIPFVGMQTSVLLVAAINLLIGLLAVFAVPAMRLRWRLSVVGATAVFCLGAFLLTPRDVVYIPQFYAEEYSSHLLYYEEGMDATITVRHMDDGDRELDVNGTCVAGLSDVLYTTQITQADLPLLLYEGFHNRRPKSVLQVGFGFGHSCRVMARHPNLTEIHCVELNPGVKTAAELYFGEANGGLFEDPRFRIFFQDARTYALASQRTYDVIMNDSIHPTVSGNASLYTRDYFMQCRRLLADDGIMSSWVPIFNLSPDDLRMIFRSFQDVFAHATLWIVTNGPNRHAVLMGLPEKLRIDFEAVRARMADPVVRADLELIDMADPYLFLNCLLLDEDGLRQFCDEIPFNTDDHPRLEYSAPRTWWMRGSDTVAWNLGEMKKHSSSVAPYVTDLGADDDEIAIAAKRLADEHEVAGLLLDGFANVARGEFDKATPLAERARRISPDNVNCRRLMARCWYGKSGEAAEQRQFEKAIDLARRAAGLEPGFAPAYLLMATIYDGRKEPHKAIAALEAAVRESPGFLHARLYLAQLYFNSGEPEKSREQLDAVLKVVPDHPAALRGMKLFQEGRQ